MSYRLAIVLIAPDVPSQATAAWTLWMDGVDFALAHEARIVGDDGGMIAERAGRAAAARHAARAAGRGRDEEAGDEAELDVSALPAVEVAVTRTVLAAHAVDIASSPAQAALAALTDELDALQAAAKASFPDDVACRRGCDLCCHQQVGLSRVEAARIEATIAALAPAARAALIATVTRATGADGDEPPPDVCGALDASGGCQIYGGRPVVCRSHGLVYWRRSLAPPLTFNRSCHLNYRATAPVPLLQIRRPPATDTEKVYDVETWAARLHAIDAAFAAELGLDAPPSLDRTIRINDLLVRLLLADQRPNSAASSAAGVVSS